MKKLILAAVFACGLVAVVEAAPSDVVTQADLKALIQRINNLEAENKAQAKRIAELEGRAAVVAVAAQPAVAGSTNAPALSVQARAKEEGTEVSESGRIYTTANGHQYYLADKMAGIFEPLSESGLKITPYGHIALEAVHNTRSTEVDVYTDYVRPKHDSRRGHTSTLSVQDSILGIMMEAPELYNGWKFRGKAEFDLAGGHANDYAFHWRHLYVEAEHEASGWTFLGGQTWHVWKMIAPSEIDGAWLENTGYPYRRSPQFRATKVFDFDDDNSLELRAGIVKNGPGMGHDRDGDGNQDNSASGWALLEGAALFQRTAFWEDPDAANNRWMIGLAGMYGRDKSHRYWDDEDGSRHFGKSDEYESKMVMMAGSLPLTTAIGKFTLCGQIFAGDNLGDIQAGVGQRVAFKDPMRKGREVGTIGGLVDLNYQVNETWSFAAGYGVDDPTDSEAEHANGICNNDRLYADVFYRVNRNLHFGFEYAHLRTKYNLVDDPGTANDDRFQFTMYYDF